MSKVEEKSLKAYPKKIEQVGNQWDGAPFDVNSERRVAYKQGYNQAEKDVAEAFARIIRGNLSMIDKSVQDKFEQLYTEITGEKMYKGFIDQQYEQSRRIIKEQIPYIGREACLYRQV